MFGKKALYCIFLDSFLLKSTELFTGNLTFPIVIVEQSSLFIQVTTVIKENKAKPLSYYSGFAKISIFFKDGAWQKEKELNQRGSLPFSAGFLLIYITTVYFAFREAILLYLWSDTKQNLSSRVTLRKLETSYIILQGKRVKKWSRHVRRASYLPILMLGLFCWIFNITHSDEGAVT